MCERERGRKYYFTQSTTETHAKWRTESQEKGGRKNKKKDHKRERKRDNDGRKKLIGKERQKTQQRKHEKTIPNCRMPAVVDNSLTLSCLPPPLSSLQRGRCFHLHSEVKEQAQRAELTCSRSDGGWMTHIGSKALESYRTLYFMLSLYTLAKDLWKWGCLFSEYLLSIYKMP